MAADPKQFIDTIYTKISDLFGGDQLFCMEWPARPLNQRQYFYDAEQNTSVLTRPMVVEEAEFRLSDDLFNLSPITGGPNGQKLSTVYNTLINNYVPDLRHLGPYIRDRAALMGFLLAESTERKEDGSPKTRMEVCKELYNTYLVEKNNWLAEKDKKLNEFGAEENLDGFAKWVTREGLVRDERLNNLFNDAVVRGLLHEVLTTLGYLNVSTMAEELERAKQRMRASMRQSIDGSMSIYPVRFQPSNWFKALKPNLSPKDLLMSRQVLLGTFKTKQDQLRRLESELAQLEVSEISPEELQEREAQLEAGKKNLQQAEDGLIQQYGEGALTAFKVAMDAYTGGALSGIGKLTEADFDLKQLADLSLPKEVASQMLKTYQANSQYLESAEQLARLRGRVAEAKARDFRTERIRIQERINQVRADLQFLQPLLSGVESAAKVSLPDDDERKLKGLRTKVINTEKKLNEEKGATPQDQAKIDDAQTKYNEAKQALDTFNATLPTLFEADGKTLKEDANSEAPSLLSPNLDDVEGENMFTDVVITSEEVQEMASQQSTNQSSNSRWGVSGWFFSAGQQSSSASASFKNEESAFKGKVELGFRVAKVTFDRGGWFNPQLFRMSHTFFKLADIRAGAGVTKDEIKQKLAEGKSLDDLAKYTDGEKKKQSYLLPAFPVAMVIAKDITIKIEVDQSNKENQRQSVEQASSGGGGFLGFSASNAQSSSSLAETSFYGATSNHLYMRIPGPQILGWFLDLIPEDKARPYEALFNEKRDGEASKILQAYDSAFFPREDKDDSEKQEPEPEVENTQGTVE